MIQRGLIEKVIVPSKQKKLSVKCLRLLNGDSNATGDDGSVLPDAENDLDAAEFGKVTSGQVSSHKGSLMVGA